MQNTTYELQCTLKMYNMAREAGLLNCHHAYYGFTEQLIVMEGWSKEKADKMRIIAYQAEQ